MPTLHFKVVDNSGSVGHRSIAERAGYLSIVNSVGAIVFGFAFGKRTLGVRRLF